MAPGTLISASMSCGGTRSNWSSGIVILSGLWVCGDEAWAGFSGLLAPGEPVDTEPSGED